MCASLLGSLFLLVMVGDGGSVATAVPCLSWPLTLCHPLEVTSLQLGFLVSLEHSHFMCKLVFAADSPLGTRLPSFVPKGALSSLEGLAPNQTNAPGREVFVFLKKKKKKVFTLLLALCRRSDLAIQTIMMLSHSI